MRTLVRAIAVVAVVGAGMVVWSGVAQGQGSYTPRQAATQLAKDYLAPVVRPDNKAVHVRSLPCSRVGRWYACRVRVTGQTTCRAVVRVLKPVGEMYTGWVPQMRCR